MSSSVDEPDQLNIDIPPDYINRIETKNAYIWSKGGVLEYIFLLIAILVTLIFLIPNSNEYKVLIYFLSLISYALVIFFVYFWSVKNDMRDIRLILIFFVFALLLSQVFHYYTLNNVVAIIMYSISLILLIYIVARGIKTWFALAMIFPIAFVIYQLIVQVLDWVYGIDTLPN